MKEISADAVTQYTCFNYQPVLLVILMRIAFYAPMKSPCHPVPSGDRLVGRLLLEALQNAGHQVFLASALRSWDNASQPGRQSRLKVLIKRKADQLLARLSSSPPDLWFSYHPYHKAPDWLGPYLTGVWNIPYVMAETSLSPRQSAGPWCSGHQATQTAIRQAAAIISLNDRDIPALLPHLSSHQRIVRLQPFTKMPTWSHQFSRRQKLQRRQRQEVVRLLPDHHLLRSDQPWLLTVAMMRAGDKHRSYTLLAESLELLLDRPWQLLVVGDGPARNEIKREFARIPTERVCWLGVQAGLWQLYAAADLLVWPAVNEAYSMAILEAQSSGLAVVAGYTTGVAQIVREGVSGLLTAAGHVQDFAAAVARLLDDQPLRVKMGVAARAKAEQEHSFQPAALVLDHAIRTLVPRAV